MNTHTLAFALLSMFAGTCSATELVLATPTGELVACAEIPSLRQTDMPRLFGVQNFHQAHETFVRFRTFAPRDCAAWAHGARLAQIGASGTRVALTARAKD